MKVTLRKREKSGKISLYLDYYHKGKRNYEYLGLFLIPKPKTKNERIENRKTLELAGNIRSKRQLESLEGVFGFDYSAKEDIRFLDYFEIMQENSPISISIFPIRAFLSSASQ